MKAEDIKEITVFIKEDFKKWLEKNHDKEKRVCLVLHKKHTGKKSPSHKELIHEAICFGWIDTTIKRLDEDRYLRNFTRRNKNSKWSENTLNYTKALIKEGRMTSYGLKFYEEGLKRPAQDYGIPKNPDMPFELKKKLSKDKKSKDCFEKFSPSKKKMIYRWILRAKLPETREKRIQLVIRGVKIGKFDL